MKHRNSKLRRRLRVYTIGTDTEQIAVWLDWLVRDGGSTRAGTQGLREFWRAEPVKKASEIFG